VHRLPHIDARPELLRRYATYAFFLVLSRAETSAHKTG
jgi:hypothetical protein